MQTGDQSLPIDREDETGQIRVVVNSGGVPAVELGFALKSTFEPIPFSFTVLMLINSALGDFQTQLIRDRSKSLVSTMSSPASSSLSVDERIERIHARVGRAREAFRSAREGQTQTETTSVGFRNRIWLEGRGGFVLDLQVNSDFYNSFSSDVIAKELNQWLEQLLAGMDAFAVIPKSWDEEG